MGIEGFVVRKGPVFYAVERELARRKAEQQARQIEAAAEEAAIVAAVIIAPEPEPEPEPRDTAPTLLEIRRAVCSHLNVSALEFLSQRRNRRIVDARAVAYWVARKHTSASFPQIGRAYERDHSSVLVALRRLDEHFAEYAADIAAVEAALGVV